MFSTERAGRRAPNFEAKVRLSGVGIHLEQDVGMRRQVKRWRPVELSRSEGLLEVALGRRVEAAQEIGQRHSRLHEIVGPYINTGVEWPLYEILSVETGDGCPEGFVYDGVYRH